MKESCGGCIEVSCAVGLDTPVPAYEATGRREGGAPPCRVCTVFLAQYLTALVAATGTVPSLLKAALSAALLFTSFDAAEAILLRMGPATALAER